jgi:hypothetical protein
LGYFLACDAQRANSYPFVAFREWARAVSVRERARSDQALVDSRN